MYSFRCCRNNRKQSLSFLYRRCNRMRCSSLLCHHYRNLYHFSMLKSNQCFDIPFQLHYQNHTSLLQYILHCRFLHIHNFSIPHQMHNNRLKLRQLVLCIPKSRCIPNWSHSHIGLCCSHPCYSGICTNSNHHDHLKEHCNNQYKEGNLYNNNLLILNIQMSHKG